MASAIIHISVAKKVNDVLKRNPKQLYLGTIAPDISKFIGRTKNESHFIFGMKDVPNLGKFKEKYPDFVDNDFLLGYYIHLYTDKVWFLYFLKSFMTNSKIKMLDGTVIQADPDLRRKALYNDYTNLNVDLISHYNLDLSLFYEEIEYPTVPFDEIPLDRLSVIVNQMGVIIKNSTESKTYILDIEDIIKFIDDTAEKIINEING